MLVIMVVVIVRGGGEGGVGSYTSHSCDSGGVSLVVRGTGSYLLLLQAQLLGQRPLLLDVPPLHLRQVHQLDSDHEQLHFYPHLHP